MNFRTAALAAASGLLLAVSFPTIQFHLLVWFALVPLLIALKNSSVRNGFWTGGITGLVYFAGTVHWVTNSVHFYGNVPLIPASLITLLLCAYLALYPALFGAALMHIRKNHPSLAFLAAPALWTALELARTYVFSGFPWSLLGYTQYTALPVIQVADITGVYGISFVIVLVNAALAELILDRKRFIPILAAGSVLALVFSYGVLQLRKPDAQPTFKVSVIQGNIEQDQKWDPAYQTQVTSVYERLTLKAAKQRPDLVLWPETATPFYFNSPGKADQDLSNDLGRFVQKTGVPVLFGSPTYEVLPGRVVRLRNSAFLLSTEAATLAEYHKFHLVPFGEYVPLKSVFFFVDKMVQAIGDFQSGSEYTVMAVPVPGQQDVKVSTVICYEIIFPDLVRRFVDKGATVITTITNDAWFGRTAAPYQHFSMAVLRAVENRVPVARAANTGISGFIDAKGRVLQTSGIFVEADLMQALAPGNTKTFYTRYGDIFSYCCVILTLILLAGYQKEKLSKKR
jgi:apolipoprotein N-acyltransferase